jgi:hypothetical protein
MLSYNDALADISSVLWNGTGWEAGLHATQTGVTVNYRRSFDFAWMSSGHGVFFYSHGPGAPNNGVYYQEFFYNNKSWGPQTLAMASTIVNTATTRQIESCANPQNDFVGVIFQDSSGDLYTFMWNGTNVEASPTVPTPDGATEAGGDNAECEWENNGKQALFAFIDNNQLSIDYYTYNLSVDMQTRSWSTAALTATYNTGNIASDDIQSVTTDRHPITDRVMLVFKDLLYDLRAVRWNGSDIEGVSTNGLIETENTAFTPTAQTQSFSFTWNRHGLRPPTFSGTVDDNSTDVNPTNEGENVTFIATAINPYGDDWYLLVCADADQEDGVCGVGGTICTSALTASGASANCTHNTTGENNSTYTWLAYACNALGACSAYENTNSPYEVNHAPTLDPYLSTYTPSVLNTITCFSNVTENDLGDSVINTYRWFHQDEGAGGFSVISGATGNQLDVPDFDSNDNITCEVTSTDNHGLTGPATNTSIATVAQGTLSATAAPNATSFPRYYNMTVDLSCTVAVGDGESVTLTLEDNRTGVFTQSTTTPGAIYVNESVFALGGLASETSPAHTVLISGQNLGDYFFRARCDASDTTPTLATSANQPVAVVPDTSAPLIIGESAEPTNETFTVTWRSDDVANSLISYGESIALGMSVFDPSLVRDHSVLVVGLVSNTAYFYNITTCNADNYCTTQGPYSVTTFGTDIALHREAGFCTGQFVETGGAHQDGVLTKGDIVEIYCESPHKLYRRDEFTITFLNDGNQLRQTFTVPTAINQPQTGIYPPR